MIIFYLFERSLLVFAGILFALILSKAYLSYISPLFAYQGMFVKEIAIDIAFIQICLAIFPILALPTEIDKPSKLQIWLLYLTVYVPAIIVGYHIVEEERWIGYTVYLMSTGYSLVMLSCVCYLPNFELPTIKVPLKYIFLFLLIFTAGTFFLLIYFYGFQKEIIQISEVYKYRWSFKEKIKDVPIIINYLYFWQGLVINPTILTIGITRKKILLIISGFITQYILFNLTTIKLFLAVPFYISAIYLFTKIVRKKRGIVLFYSTIILSIIFLILGWIYGQNSMSSRIFLQRCFLTSGQLSGAYYDFFSTNKNAFWGDSILKKHVDYEYGEMSPSQIIGDKYVSLGSPNIANATANFWADSFANAGFFGLLIVTIITGCLLWFIDSLFLNYPNDIAVVLFSVCSLSLTAQGLQTSMLTGGILPMSIIVFFGYKAFRNLS